ncbi:MAG: hypothetical protein ABSA46_00875 [Thermodesulfovibrionales bacterium]
MKHGFLKTGLIWLSVLFLHGCAHRDFSAGRSPLPQEPVEKVLRNLPLSAEFEDKVLALNPDSITGRDITEVLSRCPAPRLIALNGSIPLITMESFSKFLILMGYPEERVRNPRTRSYTYTSYMSSKHLAGLIAWHYEKEGMMPLIVGHSQGGMLSVKVLYELSGAFRDKIAVWNPYREEPEDRYAIRDPLTDIERPVVGLRVGYASAIATGRLMRFLLGQWDMLTRLRKIPDTVEEFTGFHIQNDLIGGDFLGLGQSYYPLGTAVVHNVKLPAEYSHMTIPLTEDLAKEPETREWINSYTPSTENPPLPDALRGGRNNILFAADIWHHIKKYWCIELQRLIRAQRDMKRISSVYGG